MIVRNNIHDGTIKNRSYSIEEIKTRVKGEPFVLLSTEYINAHEKLMWGCLKCGKTWLANWHNISFGKGCRNCRYLKNMEINERKKPKLFSVYELLKNKQITLLETEYVNAHTKMMVSCDKCGHEWKNDFHHFKGQNTGCPKCSIKRGKEHHKWKGGLYYQGYPREWSKELKEEVRNRDNRLCQFPDCSHSDIDYKQKLHVHHINGDKKNCQKYNLISLCNKHHMYVEGTKTRARDWEDYFYSVTSDYEIEKAGI